MKMQEARALMRRAAGYRVHFDRRENSILASDYFPERDEPAIADLEDAWKLAAEWALVDPALYVNVYVINAHDWVPVDNYEARRLNAYPPPPVVRGREKAEGTDATV